MKDFKEQDLFGNEKTAKVEKKDSTPLLDLDFSVPEKQQDKLKAEGILEKREKSDNPVERKPIVLGNAMKKNDHKKSETPSGDTVLNKPVSHEIPHKSLHELKTLAKELINKPDKTKIPQENTGTELYSKKKMDELSSTSEKINSVEADKNKALDGNHYKQHTASQPKQEVLAKKIATITSSSSKPSPKHVTITEGSSIGHILQEARVKAGFSIDQVSIETRINKSYIDAIERDDFEHLPFAVYVSAYVRRLCQQYGLDQSLAKKIAKAKSPDVNVPGEVIADLGKSKQINIEKEKRLKIMQIVISSAIVVLIAITAFFILRALNGKSNRTATVIVPPDTKKTHDMRLDEIDLRLREIMVTYPTGNMSELKAPQR